jgi:hypothetical protein
MGLFDSVIKNTSRALDPAGLLSGTLGSGSPGSVTTRASGTAGQQAVSQELADFLRERIGQGLPGYEGQQIAPLTDLQQAGIQGVSDFASSDNFATQGVEDLFGSLTDEQARADFEEFTRPLIGSLRADTDAFLKEQGLANVGTRASEGVDRLRGQGQFALDNMALQAQQQAIQANRQLRAGLAPTAMQAAQAPLTAAQAQLQAGALQQQQRQAELTSQFQEFQRTTPELNPLINQALAFLGLNQTDTIVQQPQQSGLAGFLQGVAPGVGLGLGQGLFGGSSTVASQLPVAPRQF